MSLAGIGTGRLSPDRLGMSITWLVCRPGAGKKKSPDRSGLSIHSLYRLLELLDFAAFDTREIGIHFTLDDRRQEVESEDVRHTDQEYQCVRDIQDRPQLHDAAQRHEGAKDDLVNRLTSFALSPNM